MLKQHKDNCTYMVIMEGVNGELDETECETPKEAVELKNYHKAQGLFAWIEIKPKAL